MVGACAASISEEMEWNAQGKGIFVGGDTCGGT
jgi:hypothetical protein